MSSQKDEEIVETHKVKDHFKKYAPLYGFGIGVAGFTWLIMRGVASQPIDRDIAVVARRGIAVAGKKVVMNNVSYIYSNRQGSPSWVVRCLETGNIFSSQRSAAIEMGLSQAELSNHLNGVRDHVRGFHFERICMAA